MCSLDNGVEDVTRDFLSCQLYTHNKVSRITETNVTDLDEQVLVKLLLFGNEYKYSFDINIRILRSSITFIKNSNRF